MPMILNDIWPSFNKQIQASSETTDLATKMDAVNFASGFLLKRWTMIAGIDLVPKEFLHEPVNIANTARSNQITLPSDFLRLDNLWFKQGLAATDTITYKTLTGAGVPIVGDVITGSSQSFTATVTGVDLTALELKVSFASLTKYFVLNETLTPASGLWSAIVASDCAPVYQICTKESALPWNDFVRKNSSNMFSPGQTGSGVAFFSVNKPSIYLDRYLSTASNNILKISYWKIPAKIYNYDKLTITTPASFSVGETVTGSISLASGIVTEIGSTYISINGTSKSKSFGVGDLITGLNGGTDTITVLTEKYQTLEWPDTLSDIFIQACKFCYYDIRNMDEAVGQSAFLDNMIKLEAGATTGSTKSRWGFIE